MNTFSMKHICAILVSTVIFLPMAQAGDLVERIHNNSRPVAQGPVTAPRHTMPGEVEVFVQFSVPSVAEFNIESVKKNGKMADSQSQKLQAEKISAQQAKMMKDLVALGAKVNSSLRVGANGVRILVPAKHLAAIEAMEGVRTVAPVIKHYLDNAQSVPWIGTQDFWDTVGTGEGVSVGIIDTGIDYQHENFGGDGTDTFPTTKVVGGWDFVGDDYDGDNTPVPDNDPLDCNGHGSHVAGTAAGIGVPGVIGPGVAKGADLYALRVFGCDGSTNVTSDAIEWAMDPNNDGDMSDHLDVINMSLGSPFGYANDPSAITTNNAAQLGIVVATSAGNEGNVPYITGSPGVASLAISTAASTKGGEVLGIDVSGDINDTYEAVEGTSPARLSDGPVSGLLVQDSNIVGCTASGGITVDMTGDIALISRGVCSFDEKFLNAEAAGAIGVVVYNDGADPSRIAPIVMGSVTAGIPGVMITSIDGSTLSAAIGGGASVSALLDEDIVTDTAFYDLIAGFSSRGPGHGGSTFKPDVTNPGVSIVSTAAGTVNGSLNLQGTSMASPHTAGVAALMRQLNPDLDSAAIKAIIQNSTVDMQQPLPLARQGVGRVSVTNAMSLGSYASPGGVSFGRLNPERLEYMKESVSITNFSDHSRTFTVTHVPNQTMPGVNVSCGRSVIGVSAGNTEKFKITLDMDPSLMPYDNPSFTQAEVDGWCILDDGDDTLRVGYMATVDPASRMDAKSRPHGDGLLVHNGRGWATGFADGFTLTGTDGLLLDGTNNSIDAVGFRTADPATYFGYPVMEIAIASDVPWESPSNLEWDIFLDIDGDNVDDVTLVAVDYSAFGGDLGDLVTAQFGADGGYLDWYVSAMDYNDRVAILPFTMDPYLYVPASFGYTLVVYGRDGSIDVQFGTVDTANEIIPDMSSFGLQRGGVVDLSTNKGGDMLWLFPNNVAEDQVKIVTVQ